MRRTEAEDGRKGAVSTGRNLVGLVIVALPGGEMDSEGESAGKPAGGLKCGGGGGGEKVAMWSLEGDVMSPLPLHPAPSSACTCRSGIFVRRRVIGHSQDGVLRYSGCIGCCPAGWSE